MKLPNSLRFFSQGRARIATLPAALKGFDVAYFNALLLSIFGYCGARLKTRLDAGTVRWFSLKF